MRCAVLVLCALVGGALGNTPTPLERQFAGLRIAIRNGDTAKAKKLLDDGAKKWGKAFTHRQAICESTSCTHLAFPEHSSLLESVHRAGL